MGGDRRAFRGPCGGESRSHEHRRRHTRLGQERSARSADLETACDFASRRPARSHLLLSAELDQAAKGVTRRARRCIPSARRSPQRAPAPRECLEPITMPAARTRPLGSPPSRQASRAGVDGAGGLAVDAAAAGCGGLLISTSWPPSRSSSPPSRELPKSGGVEGLGRCRSQ